MAIDFADIESEEDLKFLAKIVETARARMKGLCRERMKGLCRERMKELVALTEEYGGYEELRS